MPTFSDAISIYHGAENPVVQGETTWQEAIEAITDGNFANEIAKLRAFTDETAAKEYKKTLPAVTFGGTFHRRRARTTIDVSTGFIIPDLDHVPDVDGIFARLTADPYTWFAFRSPSGDGIKCGFRAEGIKTDADIKAFFASVEDYFLKAYGIKIDSACKDISRLTFLSHDPEAYVATDPELFPVGCERTTTEEQAERPGFKFDYGIGKQKYAAKVLESCCGKIRESLPGDQHRVRLDMACLAGGYVHYLDDATVYAALEGAVGASGAVDMKAALATVRDGLEYGKARPLTIPDREAPKNEQTAGKKAEAKREEPEPTFQLSDWISSNVFVGEPPARKFLVEGVFPMGQASLIAASGGVGKSYSCLDMLRNVAHGYAKNLFPPRHFGGTLKVRGTAVYISAEDDQIEIHNRINALGGPHEQLVTVPFPSVPGGTPLFFRLDPVTREPSVTKAWWSLVAQVKAFPDLAVVVIDPLQVFCALDLNQPENAQYVCSRVSALAAETGAAAILTHHFRKDSADSPEEARQSVRGSAGLVDGVRAVVAMWCKSEGGARDKTGGGAICKALGEFYEPEKVVMCSVVKANGKASRGVTTFIRDDSGVLRDVSDRVRSITGTPDELAELLVEAIAAAATAGRPYKQTGQAAGLFSHRHELPEPFWVMPRARIEGLCSDLLAAKRVVQCQDAKSRNLLDVPDGPFAKGNGQFVNGALPGKDAETEAAA